MAVKNQAASALARLKNQAKTEGINYQEGFDCHWFCSKKAWE